MKKIMLFFIPILISCTIKHTVSNAPEDVRNGKKITSNFYLNVKDMDIRKIVSMTSDSILMKYGPENFEKVYISAQNKLGRFQDFKVSSIETKRVLENQNIMIYYKLVNFVKYQKGKTIEAITFVKFNDEDPKINAYDVDLN